MGEELLTREQFTMQARESTYGTDEIDLANNLAVARRWEAYENVSVVHNGDSRPRNHNRPSFSNDRAQFIRRNQTWTIEGIVPCPDTAGDAPLGLADLLVASGMTETLVDDTTATYALQTKATAGLTFYHYKRLADDDTEIFTYGLGVRGDVVFNFAIRDYVRFTFTGESTNYPKTTDTATMNGWSVDLDFIDVSDGSPNLDKTGSAITYSGTITGDDPRGLFLETDAVLTIDSVAFPISAGTINMGNAVNVRERTSSSTTAGPVGRTGRNVNMNFTFETETAREKAAALLHADSESSATLVLTDGQGSGGTTVTWTFPKLQVLNVEGPQDADGHGIWTLPCQANGDHTDAVGDDEMTIVWSVTA